jgi:hypothetical protein
MLFLTFMYIFFKTSRENLQSNLDLSIQAIIDDEGEEPEEPEPLPREFQTSPRRDFPSRARENDDRGGENKNRFGKSFFFILKRFFFCWMTWIWGFQSVRYF